MDQTEHSGQPELPHEGAFAGEAIPPVDLNTEAVGMELLYDVELEATLQFGSREMPLREVLELGPGDVLELDRHVSEPVDLVIGDRIVARGEVVVASGNFALRITEVATPQLRLESIRCLF
jgi:flagellar motor switch protein FliN/FliY